MGLSNFELEEVKEARGLIVREDFGRFVEVAHGLDKFFNAEEPFAAAIDWAHDISVLEKIDGSNIRIWWDMGKWHISTLGVVAANTNEFGSLVNEFFQFHFDLYCENLDPNFTYVYELVSPDKRIVVHYEKLQLYFIEKRNIHTGEEFLEAPEALQFGVLPIKKYEIKDMVTLRQILDNLGDEHEGFVVCDYKFNRIKVKTGWYLELHKIRGNGVCTIKRIVQMWRAGALDDFVAAYPEYSNFIDNIMGIVKELVKECENQFHFNWRDTMEKKEFAFYVKKLPPIVKSYCFARFDNKVEDAATFVKEKVVVNTLVEYIEKYSEVKEFGVKEDE